MTAIDGNTMEGVSATILRTLHNRGSEAKRCDGVIGDPWVVTLLDAIDYDYLMFGKPDQSHGLRAVAGVALASSGAGLRAARDIALPPGRGWSPFASWPALDRIGPFRRMRSSITLLEFG